MQRDEIGTGLIDGMDDDEYEECKNKCKDGYKNALLRIEEAEFNQ